MRIDERPEPDLSLEELRRRVEEAEKLLRVARQLARDELRNPDSSERAKERIASLCREVNALFPRLLSLTPPDVGSEDAGDGGDAREAEPNESAEAGAGDERGDGDGDADEGDDAEPEWDVDYAKLRKAIQDPQLMGQFPDGAREEFRALALELLDAHDRQELYARVTAGFEALEQTTRQGAEEAGRQLAAALTFRGLKDRSLS